MLNMEENPGKVRFFKQLYKLAEIVLNKHYSYITDPSTKEDLISEAVLKGYELVLQGNFDAKRSSLKNYIYTGMRNEMSNYLYKNKKEVVLDEILGASTRNPGHDDYDVIYYKDIVNLTSKFAKRYGDYTGLLVSYLRDIGFHIEGCPDNTHSAVKIDDYKLLEKMVCVIIWAKPPVGIG